ncbi:protein-disulfide reductase DsbD family protein [Bythopirellula goksoeyrii]|uniref:Thiol:disulfide interchange protein DsbD n=1 Tax=Bythopirellula goksoeyrii TaxID=1400387 RepID=A0A5B9QLQ3_9BACT|nr:thioredoxin family protein [Bythopirellula goksoeyrii]QEG34993.1 Thiol:disulfide interchange protein DsbD precursor [Bythopirellula goksoeyrii]
MSEVQNLSSRRLVSLLSMLLMAWGSFANAQFEFPDTFGDVGGGLSASKDPVTVTAEFTPAEAGRPAILFVTAEIGEGFHVYALDQGSLPDGGGGPLAAAIELSANPEVRLLGSWHPTTAPDTHIDDEIWKGLQIREHAKTVTWFAPIELAQGTDPAKLEIVGKVVGQACNPQTCVPFNQQFQAQLGEGLPLPAGVRFDSAADVKASSPPLTSTGKLFSEQPGATAPVVVESGESGSFIHLLGLAFLGGLVLNVMPCVLPVIGLKVFAFIEQAGQDRWKIFALNLWYAIGVISVFLLLAVLSIVFGLGWGQLFQYPEFNIAMAAVIFAMGLSFLGIWEIPIPGFIGTSKVTEFGRKEGYEGAFAKGTITTLLATPCTGPFMGTALVGVLGRSPWQIMAIFFTIGLGMASPYILIGAFPQLIRFLPKPGEWMNTFKQLMGFVLIGTVVYLLTLLKPHYVIPTVAFLFGIWLVCWWIGRVPLTAPSNRRWNALGEGIAIGTLIGLTAFYWLAPILEYRHTRDANRLADARFEQLISEGTGEYSVRQEPWQPYSEKKLQWLLEHGKTVLIDFTADWCPTCKFMEKTVLKTDEMATVFRDNDIYTLVADWTHQDSSPEVNKKLQELGTQQIPLLAIYSAQNPTKPTLIPGTYTIAGLTEELRRAGPSLTGETKQGMANAAQGYGAASSPGAGLR